PPAPQSRGCSDPQAGTRLWRHGPDIIFQHALVLAEVCCGTCRGVEPRQTATRPAAAKPDVSLVITSQGQDPGAIECFHDAVSVIPEQPFARAEPERSIQGPMDLANV